MENRFIYIHSPILDDDGYPEDCPFSSKRSGKTLHTIESLGLIDKQETKVVAPIAVTKEELLTFHTEEYLQILKNAGHGKHDFKALQCGLGTPDCPIFENMYEYLCLASGGTVTGAQIIIDGRADVVFNLSGGFHHAKPESASGFCYINDVVIATKMLTQSGKKVLVLDLDAHHCDGVQDAFYADGRVTTISLHESGKTLFPGTGYQNEMGVGEGLGHTINVPLPVGTYDAAYYSVYQEAIEPIIRKIAPDVILLELGMDALAGDPLAHLNLTNNCLADIFGDVVELGIPLLVTGGGGYNAPNTVRGWALAWGTLLNGKEDHLMISAGMGGVMLENTAWFGGLRDRTLLSHGGYREAVDAEIRSLIEEIQKNIFPIHGIE